MSIVVCMRYAFFTGCLFFFFFFSSRRRHTRFDCDWSSDVCSSDLGAAAPGPRLRSRRRRPHGTARAVRRGGGGRGGRPGCRADRESVVEGKSVDLGGRRIIKKKKKKRKNSQ